MSEEGLISSTKIKSTRNMRYKRGDITYIKINNKFLEVRIVKEAKWYHGKDYYVSGETRYMVESEVSFNLDLKTKSYLEDDIILWEKEFLRDCRLKELGI